MGMEAGVVEPHQGEAALPAGSYATLTHVNHARRANKLLLG